MKNSVKSLIISAALVVIALPAAAQSSIYIGEAVLNAETRVLSAPVFIEGSGSIDGEAMQSFAFRMTYAPAEMVKSVRIVKGGLLEKAVPLFEATPRHQNTISYMGMFPRQQNPPAMMAFKSSHGDRNLIAHVEIALADNADLNTVISLALDEKISTLANLDGTREHSAAKGSLKIGKPTKTVMRDAVALGIK